MPNPHTVEHSCVRTLRFADSESARTRNLEKYGLQPFYATLQVYKPMFSSLSLLIMDIFIPTSLTVDLLLAFVHCLSLKLTPR